MKWQTTIPLAPRPAPRPRVTKHGVFHPKWYDEWRADFGRLITGSVKFRKPVAVSIVFTVDSVRVEISDDEGGVSVPEGSRVVVRGLRGDLDNYVKAVLDALQDRGVLTNDSLVVELHAMKDTP